MEATTLPLRVGLYTLGCKVNQYETQRIMEALAEAGFVAVPFHIPAEAYVINTCTVTAMADRKARKVIRQAHRQNPHAVIAVCGCYAEASPEAVATLPGVSIVRGDRDKMEVVPLLVEMVRRRLEEGVPRPPYRPILGFDGVHERTRGFLMVQNGCEFVCAYCIIPRVRGPQRSRPIAEVVEEARRLVEAGKREVVLTGVRLGAYGHDWLPRKPRWEPMVRLLEALHAIEGLERIRLSSLLPRDVHPRLLETIAQLPKVCPHLHLALQSGDDRTLKRMRRGYTTRRYAGLVELARSLIPDLALTTDVMVGFPGETEEEFERSCAFVERMGFARIHVFKFSPRPGTLGALLPDQVPEGVKEARSARMFEIARESAEAFHRRFLGRVVEVLAEKVDPGTGLVEGWTPHYLRVRFPGPAPLGEILPVLILETDAEGAQGLPLAEGKAPRGGGHAGFALPAGAS